MNLALDVHNLTKQLGHILPVDNISFTVNQGEILGFVGPNGAGKTTTIRMLTGQTKPTSGSLRAAGMDMVQEPNRAKGCMGVVPEVSNIYDEVSAWDNLIFAAQLYGVPKNERKKRAKELLEFFGLHERLADRSFLFRMGLLSGAVNCQFQLWVFSLRHGVFRAF